MTEVEKLYELAGIEKKLYCDICKAQEHALGLCAETKCDIFYSPFTAEKQIEIIKLLSNKYDTLCIHTQRNGIVCISVEDNGDVLWVSTSKSIEKTFTTPVIERNVL